MRRAPALADAGIENSWAGLRPMTPDEKPILGEAPHLPAFFNDCGWDGHGVMHAPAGGVLLAELILDGKATSADVSPFRVERFEGWLARD
jgi:sarcosine oxidase subunit beta